MNLSSIIIARNEAQNIKRCIESQLECIDEIVIMIDSSTTDETEEIVKRYLKVRHEIIQWKGYAATKKLAVSNTQNDWILWIDADEEITPELVNELNEFKNSNPKCYCYDVARRAFFLGKWIKHGGWYPGRVKRLFNKQHIFFDEKKVHEGLILHGDVGHLNHDLNHYTDPSIEHYFEKFNLYTSLAAEELRASLKKARLSDLLLRPLFLFIKMYIFRRGFMDGIHGLVLAIFSSHYVFTKYSKLWELTKKQ
jgi:glycosyltransferase involved in cell wall biosynthesis